MRSFTTLLLSVAIASQHALAAPTPDTSASEPLIPLVVRDAHPEAHESDAFTVKQVRNEGFVQPSGLEALMHAYAKYNATIPNDIKLAVKINVQVQEKQQKRGNMWGTAVAYSPGNSDYAYLIPVQLGIPAQTINLDLDTGSADVWMITNETPSSQVKGQQVYDLRKSRSATRLNGFSWHIGYGDGSGARGNVYYERMAIGSASYARQAIGSATSISASFTNDPNIPGLLGLGFKKGNTISPRQQNTFMDNIARSLASPVFTANLKHGTPGNYNFGYVAGFEYTGAISWAGIDQNSIYWQFYVTGFQIGSGGRFNSFIFPAIADTGTSLLLLPDSIRNAYYAQVRGAGFDSYWGAVVFPCGSFLPDFRFGQGSYRGFIPGRYMNYGQINATHCFGGIQSSGGFSFAIFGDIALKAQFVVFDYGNKRLGFANKRLT